VSALGQRIEIQGEVQGVGFRPWVWRLATEAGLAGCVRNDATGVTIKAFGERPALDTFLRRLREPPPPAACIRTFRAVEIPVETLEHFSIVASLAASVPRVSIPPDLAVCDGCLAELFDPLDRRYRYPFINCTHCGPRFTITQSIPYDRPGTTMAPFEMCPECRREYTDPRDRRFHAQPNACPECGPRLVLVSGAGDRVETDDVFAEATRQLTGGSILAVKGLGGFHLACDATDPVAVARLRERKGRDAKPFAVMVADLEAARGLAAIAPQEEALLCGVERPIVLLRRRFDDEADPLAPQVAPCNPLVGLLLPYTPIHHLLLAAAGRPLVMTSGNRSEEPIAASNEEAVARLGGIADAFLLHDREVASRCDDSVVRLVAEGPMLLRRSRGWVPRPVELRRPVDRPILGCGAQLKNTFCVAVGDQAYLGPHIGDLDTVESFSYFQEAVDRMERFLEVAPEVVAHDLHPDYLSTRYARERPAALHLGVQHHHAHFCSALAEHGIEGPALGIIYDGTGYGPDGTAWGGEILLGDAASFTRVGTFRPLALAGADVAIRQVWRQALALVEDAFEGEPPLAKIPLFRDLPAADIEVVRRMIARGVNSPRARGVGRYFDAFGALFLGRKFASYEGQVAQEWGFVAVSDQRGTYPYRLERQSAPWEIDLRPLVRAAVADFLGGLPAAGISARFHHTLAAATVAVVTAWAEETGGGLPIVLSGGCFQNELLAGEIVTRLGGSHRVLVHRQVPPGDGGIALGQVVAAAERLRTLTSSERGAATCV